MEINKVELQTMIREFWSTKNNDTCETMTHIFLKRIGLTNREIANWLDSVRTKFPEITKQEEKVYLEAIDNTKNYYSYED